MRATQLTLFITLLLSGMMGGTLAQQVEVRATDTLKPEDLDIHKWVFEAQTKPSEVAVLRERTYREGKLERTYELVTYQPDKISSASVLLLSHDFLAGENGSGNYSIKADSGGGNLARQPLHNAILGTCYAKDQTVIISFASNRDEMARGQPQKLLRFEYDFRVEDYDALKKQIPELPPSDKLSSWYRQDPAPVK